MMRSMRDALWLLPAGIEEILPQQAHLLECLRRDLLDLYSGWGYELVIPPLVDFLDSLLTGTGHDLDLQTFKLTDQLSGRMLGARADMTPQVARIDAHHLCSDAPTRLCYLGSVLHTRSDGFSGTRSPMQIGAEIYGHSGVESDVEVLRLALLTLEVAGIENPYLDLGHVGIYRGLARQAGLDEQQETTLFEALQRKAAPEIVALIEGQGLPCATAHMMLSLVDLNGDDALERAATELVAADRPVHAALDYLRRLVDEIRRWLPEVPIHFDLAELRGYHYKTGMVFAAFAPGWGQEIARGGRYDDIGRVFGRPRPAIGFSADLKGLLRLGVGLDERYRTEDRVFAPWSSDPALERKIQCLREAGRQVVTELPGQVGCARQLGCGERLERRGADWVLVPVEDSRMNSNPASDPAFEGN
jgi:ATP phosphoribosyltransferase regulatory subunit